MTEELPAIVESVVSVIIRSRDGAAAHVLVKCGLLNSFGYSFFSPLWCRESVLRKQLALYQERRVKPRRTMRTTRLAMVALANFFGWRDSLVIVKPETLIKCIGRRSNFCEGSHVGEKTPLLRTAGVGSPGGTGEPDVGRGENRGRTALEAGIRVRREP